MRRSIALLTAALTVIAAGPAGAWFTYPPDDHADALIVELDGTLPEIVPLRSLPGPFDAVLVRPDIGPRLSFRWRYDGNAQGMAVIVVNGAGTAEIRVRFAVRNGGQAARLGAALVLLDGGGAPLHTLYVSPEAPMTEDRAFRSREVVMRMARKPPWWEGVASIAFLRMTYHPMRGLNEGQLLRSMRRAVGEVTRGRGTEQHG